MTYYFAYGSLMHPDQLRKLGDPDAITFRVARLDGYRLAFTRNSRTWSSAAADVVPDDRSCVWGVAYEADDDFSAELAEREGLGTAYTLQRVTLSTRSDSLEAETAVVKDKEYGLGLPTVEYLDTLADGAAHRGLPEDYVAFLSCLRHEAMRQVATNAYLTTYPTSDREGAGGASIVVLHPQRAADLGLGRYAVVTLAGKGCVAKVKQDRGVGRDECQIDQAIRESLGAPGPVSFGLPVQVQPLTGRRGLHTRLVKSRSLILTMRMASKSDSEKNIVVIHPRNIVLLGLEEGDYADVLAAVEQQGRWVVKRLTRRVYAGTASQIRPMGVPEDYPQVQFCYIDLDGRRTLGDGDGDGDVAERYPVVVRPNLGHVFSKRVIFYGLSVLLGLEAIDLLLGRPLVSLALALVLTCAVALIDLRGRLRY